VSLPTRDAPCRGHTPVVLGRLGVAELLEFLPQQHGETTAVKTGEPYPPILVKVEVRQTCHLQRMATTVKIDPERKIQKFLKFKFYPKKLYTKYQ
jgi:hypothetical protein